MAEQVEEKYLLQNLELSAPDHVLRDKYGRVGKLLRKGIEEWQPVYDQLCITHEAVIVIVEELEGMDDTEKVESPFYKEQDGIVDESVKLKVCLSVILVETMARVLEVFEGVEDVSSVKEVLDFCNRIREWIREALSGDTEEYNFFSMAGALRYLRDVSDTRFVVLGS